MARFAASLARARRREFPSREALAEIVESLARRAVPDAPRARPTCATRARTSTSATRSTRALSSLLAQVRLELRYTRATSRVGRRLDARRRRSCASSAPRCRASRRCSTATCSPRSKATRRRAASTRCCCAIPACMAMIHHRIAHQLYRLGVPLLARIVAELAHAQTGIDIHPGAHDRRRASSSTTARAS